MKGLFIVLLASMALVSSCKKENCYLCVAKCVNGSSHVIGDTEKTVCTEADKDYLQQHTAPMNNGQGCPWTCTLK